jgi:hypothetical protein
MAEAIIQVPVDGSGKKLRTIEQTIGANLIEQQVITLADSTGNLINATSNRLLVDGSGVTQPVSVANGSNVTQGAIADSAYTDTTGAASGSVIALLKGLFKLIAGTLTFKRALGTTTITGATVTTTSTQVIASNTGRKSLLIINNSTQAVYINAGTASAANTSIAVQPSGGTFSTETTSSAFQAIVASGTASITVVEDA